MLLRVLSSLLYRSTRRPMLRLVTDRVSRLMTEHDNRRDFYRVYFPVDVRPRLLLSGPAAVHTVCEVIECSERGLRFESPVEWLHPTGTMVAGRLTFARGAEVEVAGTVVRVQGGSVALSLSRRPIPLGIILDEQRYLRANFLHVAE